MSYYEEAEDVSKYDEVDYPAPKCEHYATLWDDGSCNCDSADDEWPGEGEISPCPACGAEQTPEQLWDGSWSVCCANCYDADCVGDPPQYVSTCLQVYGKTREAAIKEWNEAVEEEKS